MNTEENVIEPNVEEKDNVLQELLEATEYVNPAVVIKGRTTAVGITRPDKEESKARKKISKASRRKNQKISNKKRSFSKRPNKRS